MTSASPKGMDRSRASGFPLLLFALTLVISVVAAALAGWQSWRLQDRFGTVMEQHFGITEYISKVLVFNEALTMSAHMAALTGDATHVQRYDKLEGELDALIKKTRGGQHRPEIRKLVEQTDEANSKLVEIERRSFALNAEGRRPEAAALLVSREYLKWKGLYADAVEQIAGAQAELIESERRHLYSLATAFDAAIALIIVVLVSTWYFALRAGRRWQQERLELEGTLRKTHEELEERVSKRTADLRTANETLHHNAEALGREVEERRTVERALQEIIHRTKLQLAVVEQVGQEEELLSGDVEGLARKVTELAARTIGCERANVWLFDETETTLRCIDLFEATPGSHSAGEALQENEYRHEFQVLKHARYVDADDPLTDPRTAGYVETYLKPLHITSMLDTVIQISGKNLGLLCFEHVDQPHHWERDEIAFAGQLADKLGMALISRVRRQAEDESHANERKLRDLVEIISDYIWEIDENGAYTYVSPKVTSIIGYTPEELLGKSPFAFMSPAESKRVEAAFAPFLSGRLPFVQMENTVLHRDGREIIFETAAVPIFGVQGEFRGYRGVDRDITERKRAEAALRESRQLIEGILNAMPVRVFWKDLNLTYLGCNTAFARDSGFTDAKDLIGKDDYQMGWRDQAELYRADDRRVIESGQPKLLIEEPQTTPDGRTITLLTSKLPLRGSNGEVYGVLGTYTDITGRKETEDALRRSEERFRAVSETAQDAIIMIDAAGQIVFWNRAAERILGYTVDETIGRDAHTLLAPARFRDKATAGLREFAATGQGEVIGKTLELAALRKDGIEIPVELSIASMRLGTKWHAVATLRDITQRKCIEDEMRKMARRDFLTGLANRAEFVDKLEQEIVRAHRGARFAVLYLDLDHFKDVNDSLGHPVGDLLLKMVGQRLRAAVRETDTVARFGGDEFAVIEVDSHEPSVAVVVAEKILKALSAPFSIDGKEIRSGASIGIALYGPDGTDAETLLNHADVALYRAKTEGRGTYRFFTDAMDKVGT